MKRFMVFCMTGVLCASLAVPAFAGVETNASKWAVPVMEQAYDNGLLSQDLLSKAQSPITRQEFSHIAVNFVTSVTGKKISAQGKSPFGDCDDPVVTAAYELGIIGGEKKGVFAPDGVLTREQMCIIIGRTMEVCGIDLVSESETAPFTDLASTYNAARRYIGMLYGADIISGYKDGTFKPEQKLIVQEAVAAFISAFDYAEKHKDSVEFTPLEKPAEKPAEAAKDADTVLIGGKSISLGEPVSELKKAWGGPNRVDRTIYGAERHIYLNDHKEMFFVTVENGEVVEIFVPGRHFEYQGIKGGTTTADMRVLNKVNDDLHCAVMGDDESEARLLLDYKGAVSALQLNSKMYALSKSPEKKITSSMEDGLEKEIMDMIQMYRRENDHALLKSDHLLKRSAGDHSRDMAEHHYFDYNSQDGTTPFERMAKAGKRFTSASELIAMEKGDIADIFQEWLRSPSRIGALEGDLKSAGVGAAVRGSTVYVTVDLAG